MMNYEIKFCYLWNHGLKGMLVMLFTCNFEILLSDMVHLLCGGVYFNCMNVKLLVYCEWKVTTMKACYVK